MPVDFGIFGPTTPYMTPAEVRRAPTALDLGNLVVGGSQAEQDAELGRTIVRASSMMNDMISRSLAATVITETGHIATPRDGWLRIHTRFTPILEVRSISLGSPGGATFGAMVGSGWAPDLSRAVIEPYMISVPWGGRHRPWVALTYVPGFPVTTFAAPAAAGDRSIVVADPTGIVPGRVALSVEDEAAFEVVTPVAVTGNVVTVATPLQFPHAPGVGTHALPETIKEACLQMLSYLLGRRDSYSLVMGNTSAGSGANPAGRDILSDISAMLSGYARVL